MNKSVEGQMLKGVVIRLLTLVLTFAPQRLLAQTELPPIESVTVEAPKTVKPTPFLTGGSRWMLPICPVTVGLMTTENQHVAERVRQVAELVGAPFRAAGHCNTNVEIVFTAKPQEFLDAVADKRYRLLGGATPTEAKKTGQIRYPIQSWYSVALMDEQGNLLLQPPEDDECDPYCFFYGAKPERVVIGSVIIVVDLNKVLGRKLDAVSDYVALMALTQAWAFAKCQPAPSIANLITADCAPALQPDELTAGDIAWMRGLYYMSPERARKVDEEQLAAAVATATGGDGK